MATWFEIIFTGEPTEADFRRVAELAEQGCTSGQLLNDPDDDDEESPATGWHFPPPPAGANLGRAVTAAQAGRIQATARSAGGTGRPPAGRVTMQPYRGADGVNHASWFDPDKAAVVFTRADIQFQDNPDQAGGTYSQRHSSWLCRTAGGRWALKGGPAAPGGWQWITADEARDLLIAGFKAPDTEIARWLPEVEDEHGPGRPGIGKQVSVALDTETRRRVEQLAAGGSRAAVMRDLISRGLAEVEVGQ